MKAIARAMACCMAAFALLLSGSPSLAQSAGVTPGTYMLQGGSYTISVEVSGSNLIVHEPNRDTTYLPAADGSWHAYSEKTGATYGIRLIDARTIEAFKPGVEGNVPTRLVLVDSAVPTGQAVENPDSERWSEIATKYMERSQSDPANVQSWVACGAVALKRSAASQEDADAYARQMAEMLRAMDATSSPCPEVFQF